MNLRKWKNTLRRNLLGESDEMENHDHPVCPKCGRTMDFHGNNNGADYPLGEGYWKCTSCDFSITENEIWDSR